MVKLLFAALVFLSLGSASAAVPDEAASAQAAPPLATSLHAREGKVALPGGIAALDLPADFRYLDPVDTSRLLQAWGNPPDTQTLGMIVPAGVDPMAGEGWGVIVTYNKDGHVKDDDADGIDYAKLLKDMQDSAVAANAERTKQGYPAMTLVGWAGTPHYDKASHKLYWAEELQSSDSPHHGLNYNIRILGRQGVLVLNAVASLDQLGQIKSEMQKVTAATNFTAGNRYADFDGGTDKVAGYGIAALVAGGVAAKLGLFAKMIALLVAFKKLLVIGLAAAGSTIWRLFKRAPKAGPVAPLALADADAVVDADAPAGKVDLAKREPEQVD